MLLIFHQLETPENQQSRCLNQNGTNSYGFFQVGRYTIRPMSNEKTLVV